MSLLGAALLTVLIGVAVGLLGTQIPAKRQTGPAASIAIAAVGAVLSGFVLPQFGVPVSKSLSMGVATSAIGAILALAVAHVLKNTSASGINRLLLFRLAWWFGGALWLANAVLVLASMPLARHAISEQTTMISTLVAIAFSAAGFLVLRIAGQVSDICRVQVAEAPPLAHRLRGLLTSLIVAGFAWDAILLLVGAAFLSRIGEGFAIFG